MSTYSERVYSTETGNTCPHCGKFFKACICQARVDNKSSGNDSKVRVSRETKGRKGSGVSIISGLPLSDSELKALAKKLKGVCSAGGAVKNGVIEIQGEHRDQLLAELLKLGYSALKSGG